jgi:hypothetical protein
MDLPDTFWFRQKRMPKQNTFFYVVFVDDEQPRKLLDTIRFLADPGEKLSAHITVRGPYKHRRPLEKARKNLEGAEIHVGEVGAFFDTQQNTVFLHCDAPELRRAWYKPNFPEYAPHITLYDGVSRSFAIRLQEILRRWTRHFSFKADGMVPVKSSKGQRAVDLAAFYDSDLVASATGRSVEAEHVPSLADEDRLVLIEDVWKHWVMRRPDATSTRILPV